jgi:hypothetical protein
MSPPYGACKEVLVAIKAPGTGAAGFIGPTLSHRLLDRGDVLVGIDMVNDYWSVRSKRIGWHV